MPRETMNKGKQIKEKIQEDDKERDEVQQIRNRRKRKYQRGWNKTIKEKTTRKEKIM